MALAFGAPMGTVLTLSLQQNTSIFAPLEWVPSLAQFQLVLTDLYYLRIIAETLGIGVTVALMSAILGFPIALWLAKLPSQWRGIAVAIVLIPLLTNVVVRSVGLLLLLANGGPVSSLTGLNLLFTEAAVVIALVQVFMPFLIMALFDSLSSRDPRLDEAASSLGAGPCDRFLLVTLPLALPALRAGITIVFLLATTAYVSATLLGGKKVWVVGMLVYEEALLIQNYPLASALAMTLLMLCLAGTVVISALFRRLTPWLGAQETPPQSRSRFALLPRGLAGTLDRFGVWIGRVLFAVGLALLLLPLLFVLVNSVNDVPQATTAAWRGFTWKWYERILFDGSSYIDAAIISAQLGIVSALCAVLIALPAAFALVRYPSRAMGFTGTLFLLPLALPGIALALGVLKLLQVFVLLPPFMGLVLVHGVLIAPFTLIMLRAAVENMDVRLEEAAASLGANRLATFWYIVLPTITPAILASAIIAFLVSFGEVTVTAFLTTARLLTLPVRIYADVQFDVEPTVNAVSALVIIGTGLALVILNRFISLDRVWAR
ncbi:MAG: ABC transporter permease subunit [Pseudomonadota bacterium]